jgi:hypothetical protein
LTWINHETRNQGVSFLIFQEDQQRLSKVRQWSAPIGTRCAVAIILDQHTFDLLLRQRLPADINERLS